VLGRRPELAAIERLGHPGGPVRALCFEGPAGIGKTTLLEAGARTLRSRGYLVLETRPTEREAELPLCGLLDLLDAVGPPWPARLSPGVCGILDATLQRSPPAEQASRLTLARSVLSAFAAASETAPVAVVVDDLQWLDTPTMVILEYVLRRHGAARVLLAIRNSRGDSLPLGLDRTPRFGVERIVLEPLPQRILGRLIAERLGRDLPAPMLSELHRVAGGNPYHSLEIVRALSGLEQPLDRVGHLPVPSGIAQLLDLRLRALTPHAMRAVLVAALVSAMTVGLIERLTESLDGLEEAILAGIIRREGDVLRLDHPLLAAAALHAATPSEIRATHLLLAEHGAGASRAIHLALATSAPDEEIAREVAAAANAARRLAAHDHAAELGEHALRLTPDTSPRRASRAAEAAQHLVAAGRFERARELLAGAAHRIPAGPAKGALDYAEALVCYRADNLRDAVSLLASAAHHSAGDPALSAKVAHARAFMATGHAGTEECLRLAKAALAAAERTGDAPAVSLGLTRMAVAEFLSGGGYERDAFETALASEDHLEDVLPEWLPSLWYACNAGFADDIDTARRIFRSRLRPRIDRDGELAFPLLAFQAQFECFAGDWEAADRLADEGVELGFLDEFPLRRSMALGGRALIDAHLGRVDTARAAGREGLALAERYGAGQPLMLNHWALGFLEQSLGNVAAAIDHLGPLAQTAWQVGFREPGLVRFVPDAIEALIQLGNRAEAHRLLDDFASAARSAGRVSMMAAAYRCRALLAGASGEDDEAEAAVREALGYHERIAQPFERARTLLAGGCLARAAGRRGDARRRLDASLATFEALGAQLYAMRTRTELAHIPGRRRQPPNGALTEAERRIASLALRGLTNRQIAETLFVSVRTVEANLGRVYAKRGIRSRAELAKALGDAD